MRLKSNMEYTPYTSLYNFPSSSDLKTVSNPQYEKEIETMFDDLVESYRTLYDVDTGELELREQQRYRDVLYADVNLPKYVSPMHLQTTSLSADELNKTEQKKTVRKNINSTIDPRKI